MHISDWSSDVCSSDLQTAHNHEKRDLRNVSSSKHPSSQTIQRRHQLRRQWRTEHIRRAPIVERELQAGGMQEHAFEASVLAQPAIGLAVAIFFVAGNRMPKMRGMHANLVGAPG